MADVSAGNTHDITLSDGAQTWGLKLSNGPRSIQETPMTPSTLFLNNSGKKWGDFDPSMAHIEQRTWMGGRGNENFVDDGERFFDSMNCWTMQEKAFPTLQWKFATGYRTADMYQPGSVSWQPLLSTRRYMAVYFAAGASYNADKAYLWIRRKGNPGTLTFELRSDSSGPGSVLQTVTKAATDFADVISYLMKFDWSSTQALTSGTTYWIVVYGASTDNKANHWEIGYALAAATNAGRISAAGSSWSNTDDKIYYRVTDADVAKRWLMRKGTVNATDYLTFVDIKGSGNSQFYYVSSGTTLTEIGSTGLTVVSDYLSEGAKWYFAQGESTNIRRWDGVTTWADDGTNKATFIKLLNDSADGPQIWRGNISSVSRANVASGATNLVFRTAITLDNTGYQITGLTDYQNQLWVGKANSLWSIQNDRASKVNLGIESTPNSVNSAAIRAHGLFLYFSYLHSLQRMYGGTVDDIGLWKGSGMPSGRNGPIASMESVLSWLVCALDAGASGTSAVMLYDGRGWHEVYRAFESGRRIRQVAWQIKTSGGRLWADVGGDLMYCDFPLETLYPLRDTSVNYHNECVLISSSYDMGAANLPKAFKEINLITENLNTNTYITVDYQTDEDIGTDNWIEASTAYSSPVATIPLNVQCYAIRFRYRMNTSVSTTPPVLKGTVLEGFARTPVRYQWVIRAKVSGFQTTYTGAPDQDQNKFLAWMIKTAGSANILTMRCPTLPTMNEKRVVMEPPTPWRSFMSSLLQLWGGDVVVTLREV